MGKKCTLQSWPDSQNCIGCPNGTFVMGGENNTRIDDSAYLCFSNKETQDKDCWSNIKHELTPIELENFFLDNGFHVYLNTDVDPQTAELEIWTERNVDMLINLNPFTVDSFASYVKDFDIDEEITLHRQGKLYCDHFTIKQSLEDFENYHKFLIEILTKLMTYHDENYARKNA